MPILTRNIDTSDGMRSGEIYRIRVTISEVAVPSTDVRRDLLRQLALDFADFRIQTMVSPIGVATSGSGAGAISLVAPRGCNFGIEIFGGCNADGTEWVVEGTARRPVTFAELREFVAARTRRMGLIELRALTRGESALADLGADLGGAVDASREAVTGAVDAAADAAAAIGDALPSLRTLLLVGAAGVGVVFAAKVLS